MTTYYVGPGGSNAAAGTSYALRWLTIAKALGAAGIASGDTLYITPGVYRETVTVAMTSATVDTQIIGDVDGSHTSGIPGEVQWTAFTTNDTTAPAATACLTMNARDFLTFRNIHFVQGGASAINIAVGSTNLNFIDCQFQQGSSGGTLQRLVSTVAGAGVNSAWLFDRCFFLAGTANAANCMLDFVMTRHTADYDANIIIRNSILIGGGSASVRIASTGAGAGFGGGVVVENCTVIGQGALSCQDANLSTTFPCVVKNSYLLCGTTALNATSSGQVVESNNLISGSATPRVNVTAGAGSQTTYSPAMHLGQERLFGGQPRPFFTPLEGSALLGFGNAASPPAVDHLNRPRPAGGATTNGAGALERHDDGVKDTVVFDTGTLAVRLTGPGDHQFIIPVTSGVSRDITLKVNYDTNHATTNPPQAQLLANNAIGYAGNTQTAAASTGTWLTLTFPQFTPTATGFVIMRLVSRAAAANGYAVFDSVTIT